MSKLVKNVNAEIGVKGKRRFGKAKRNAGTLLIQTTSKDEATYNDDKKVVEKQYRSIDEFNKIVYIYDVKTCAEKCLTFDLYEKSIKK